MFSYNHNNLLHLLYRFYVLIHSQLKFLSISVFYSVVTSRYFTYNERVYNATLPHKPTVSRLESVLQIVDVFAYHHCPVCSLNNKTWRVGVPPLPCLKSTRSAVVLRLRNMFLTTPCKSGFYFTYHRNLCYKIGGFFRKNII